MRGAVQGVGFRPFAYGLASRLALSGFVCNDAEGVLIEVEGPRAEAFLSELEAAAPPLARIDSIEVDAIAALGGEGFVIEATRQGRSTTRIGADAAVCEACLDELFDPTSRFFGYPLITCTHCGPRYTLTHALPYDRAQTSMAPFPMCEACARDYADPTNRRFHAEPIACPDCGPKLNSPVGDVAAALRKGRSSRSRASAAFTSCATRTTKAPCSDLAPAKRARRQALCGDGHESGQRGASRRGRSAGARVALASARPIVLARSRGVVAPGVAPGLRDIGLMLAYTPLHWLVLHALAGSPDFRAWRDAPSDLALVATSANLGGEPLVASDEDARRRLSGVADLIVTHEREIVVRADNSVVRVLDGGPAFLRRARGFVPDPIDLGADGPSVIAAGADLKNTVTITRGREAFVSQHFGDLDDRETIRFRDEAIRHLTSILEVEPECAVCDLHPDFVSTRSAESSGLPVIAVQHHVAHVAAVVAETRWSGPVLGVALDGHGYGADGAPWGGELILLDGARWTRVGALEPLALPGGDKAAREPWRMGLAMLHRLGRLDEAPRLFPGMPDAARLSGALARGARFAVTTSLGRLFDAAAALAGVCLRQDYEGQAAMELEALVARPRIVAGGWRIEDGRLDLAPMMETMLSERLVGREAAETFHGTLIAGLAEWVGAEASARGATRVALGGGCMMNRVLSEGLIGALRAQGLTPASPRWRFPANDGGLSFGQAAYASPGRAPGGNGMEE